MNPNEDDMTSRANARAVSPEAAPGVNDETPRKSTRGRKKGFGPRHEDRRVQILRTAAQLFSTHGYEATSLDMIAEQLAMHKATLYHYIRNKEEVLYQCLVKSFEDLDAVTAQCQDARLTALARLRMFAHALAKSQNSEFGRCMLLVGARPLDLRSKEILDFKTRLDTTVRELVAEGVARGELLPCDPALVSALYFGALNWVPHWFREHGRLALDEVVDAFMDMIFNGLVVRRRPRQG